MIWPIILAGGIGKLVMDVNESTKLDERALKKLSKAYEKEASAKLLIQQKAKEAETALQKVVNRKRGIMASSMKQFITLYQKVIRIDFQEQIDFNTKALTVDDIRVLKSESIKALEPMSNSEMAVAILKGGIIGGIAGGIGELIKEDSKREYAQANRQLRAANVMYTQAENMGAAISILTQRCNAIATTLARLNVLFFKSIQVSEALIEARGMKRDAYTSEDREKIRTCMNMAKAIKDIIDAPVVEKGTISQEMENTLKIGEKFFNSTSTL